MHRLWSASQPTRSNHVCLSPIITEFSLDRSREDACDIGGTTSTTDRQRVHHSSRRRRRESNEKKWRNSNIKFPRTSIKPKPPMHWAAFCPTDKIEPKFSPLEWRWRLALTCFSFNLVVITSLAMHHGPFDFALHTTRVAVVLVFLVAWVASPWICSWTEPRAVLGACTHQWEEPF
jgi:hypothetical protein